MTFDIAFRFLGRFNYSLWKYDVDTQLYLHNLITREFNFLVGNEDGTL